MRPDAKYLQQRLLSVGKRWTEERAWRVGLRDGVRPLRSTSCSAGSRKEGRLRDFERWEAAPLVFARPVPIAPRPDRARAWVRVPQARGLAEAYTVGSRVLLGLSVTRVGVTLRSHPFSWLLSEH